MTKPRAKAPVQHLTSLDRGAEFRMPERLYDALPAMVRALDEPNPEEIGDGALRRLIGVLGSTLNLARASAAELEDRQDVSRAPLHRLPDLAEWIGWPLDAEDSASWREELRRAPELYRALGTEPGLRALVARATGWRVEFQRMADRVLLTNVPERGWTRKIAPDLESRTINTLDGEALAKMGTPHDRVHYTFELGRYDASTIHAFLSVGEASPQQIARGLRDLERLVAPLTPLNVNIRWFLVREAPTNTEQMSLASRLADAHTDSRDSTP